MTSRYSVRPTVQIPPLPDPLIPWLRRCVKDLKISRIGFIHEQAGLEISLRHSCRKHKDDLVVCYRDADGCSPATPP
jgi:hypothetical protein